MITVISGTNRKNSGCLLFAKHYYTRLAALGGEEVKLLALENIAHDWFHPEMYKKGFQSESLVALQDEYIVPASKFVFVISEYNGGVPGALKLFIDACSVRSYSESFNNKKAALTGVASGRAGNLRGMDHFSAVLNHLGITVMPNKLPISKINELTDTKGQLKDVDTIKTIDNQILEFLLF